MINIWVDDIRTAPLGYLWAKSVNHAIRLIQRFKDNIDIIDLDHDAGRFAYDGGDYIKILDYLEENNLQYRIRIHSMNPVGVENMRRIIRRNGWTEIR